MGQGVQTQANATTGVNSASPTTISFSGVVFDDAGFFNAGNPSRLTVPAGLAGLYMINANFAWPVSATGSRTVTLRKNATSTLALSQEQNAGAADLVVENVTWIGRLAVGDFVEIQATQDSGGTLTAPFVANNYPNLAMAFLGS